MAQETIDRPPDDMNGWMALALLLFIIGAFLIDIGWNQRVYGDWTCAFGHCVRIK